MRPPYQLPTPVNWPPFEPMELPSALKDDLEGILRPFYLATLELDRTVCRYEMFVAIGRDWIFVNKVNGTTVAPGIVTIKGCINTALVISLHALFDDDSGAVSLKAILNRVLRSQQTDRFRAFHRSADTGFDTDQERQRLLRLQRRLSRGDTAKSVARLGHFRNQIVAHLDIQPEFRDGVPTGRDMVIVLGAAANIVVSLVRFVFPHRRITPQLIRKNAQLQAQRFSQAVRPSNIGRIIEPAFPTFFSPGWDHSMEERS